MTELQTQELYTDVLELLDIFNEFNPIHDDGNYVLEAVKPTIIEMIDYIVKSADEAAALKDWLDNTDFWNAPAFIQFHGQPPLALRFFRLLRLQLAVRALPLSSLFVKHRLHYGFQSDHVLFIPALADSGNDIGNRRADKTGDGRIEGDQQGV